jgi:hypothetical protein
MPDNLPAPLLSSGAMDRLAYTVQALRNRLNPRLPGNADLDAYVMAAMPSLILLAANQENPQRSGQPE